MEKKSIAKYLCLMDFAKTVTEMSFVVQDFEKKKNKTKKYLSDLVASKESIN